MTTDDIIKTVEAIKAVKGDAETAHSMEDELHHEVLAHIASCTCQNPAALAREALKTASIRFPRWCA